MRGHAEGFVRSPERWTTSPLPTASQACYCPAMQASDQETEEALLAQIAAINQRLQQSGGEGASPVSAPGRPLGASQSVEDAASAHLRHPPRQGQQRALAVDDSDFYRGWPLEDTPVARDAAANVLHSTKQHIGQAISAHAQRARSSTASHASTSSGGSSQPHSRHYSPKPLSTQAGPASPLRHAWRDATSPSHAAPVRSLHDEFSSDSDSDSENVVKPHMTPHRDSSSDSSDSDDSFCLASGAVQSSAVGESAAASLLRLTLAGATAVAAGTPPQTASDLNLQRHVSPVKSSWGSPATEASPAVAPSPEPQPTSSARTAASKPASPSSAHVRPLSLGSCADSNSSPRSRGFLSVSDLSPPKPASRPLKPAGAGGTFGTSNRFRAGAVTPAPTRRSPKAISKSAAQKAAMQRLSGTGRRRAAPTSAVRQGSGRGGRGRGARGRGRAPAQRRMTRGRGTGSRGTSARAGPDQPAVPTRTGPAASTQRAHPPTRPVQGPSPGAQPGATPPAPQTLSAPKHRESPVSTPTASAVATALLDVKRRAAALLEGAGVAQGSPAPPGALDFARAVEGLETSLLNPGVILAHQRRVSPPHQPASPMPGDETEGAPQARAAPMPVPPRRGRTGRDASEGRTAGGQAGADQPGPRSRNAKPLPAKWARRFARQGLSPPPASAVEAQQHQHGSPLPPAYAIPEGSTTPPPPASQPPPASPPHLGDVPASLRMMVSTVQGPSSPHEDAREPSHASTSSLHTSAQVQLAELEHTTASAASASSAIAPKPHSALEVSPVRLSPASGADTPGATSPVASEASAPDMTSSPQANLQSARVLAEFQGDPAQHQVNLRAEDVGGMVIVLQPLPSGWWFIQRSDGAEGYVPGSYLQESAPAVSPKQDGLGGGEGSSERGSPLQDEWLHLTPAQPRMPSSAMPGAHGHASAHAAAAQTPLGVMTNHAIAPALAAVAALAGGNSPRARAAAETRQQEDSDEGAEPSTPRSAGGGHGQGLSRTPREGAGLAAGEARLPLGGLKGGGTVTQGTQGPHDSHEGQETGTGKGGEDDEQAEDEPAPPPHPLLPSPAAAAAAAAAGIALPPSPRDSKTGPSLRAVVSPPPGAGFTLPRAARGLVRPQPRPLRQQPRGGADALPPPPSIALVASPPVIRGMPAGPPASQSGVSRSRHGNNPRHPPGIPPIAASSASTPVPMPRQVPVPVRRLHKSTLR